MSTLNEPLVDAPNTDRQDGARFNSDDRRQTYEPTPLGFAIQHTQASDGNDVGDDDAESPAWDVDADRRSAPRAGGSLASAVEAGPSGADPDYSRVGDGRDRPRQRPDPGARRA